SGVLVLTRVNAFADNEHDSEASMRFIVSAILACAIFAPVTLHASLSYTCDPSITSNVNQAPGGTCAFLNTTVAAMYNNTFANVTSGIYVTLGDTGLGQSAFNLMGVSYSDYTTAFQGESTDAAALASLPATEPDVTGDVFLTPAEANALNIPIGLPLGVRSD